MVTCAQCEGIERQFSRKPAEKELRRFRRRGPVPTTKILIAELAAGGATAGSLLDVGGGIGAMHHMLLDDGVREAVQVDVSPAYISVAQEEARRRGHTDRVRFVRGDFVALADELAAADIVTLDRVICCYPDMEQLVAGAANKARRLLGAVYPRETRFVRAMLAMTNLVMRLRRTAFRVYLHPPRVIERSMLRRGLVRRSSRRTLVWEIVVYERGADTSPDLSRRERHAGGTFTGIGGSSPATPSVSGIRRATSIPDASVSPPMEATAADIPKTSASTPASTAPTTYPESRHRRYMPTAEPRQDGCARSPIAARSVG